MGSHLKYSILALRELEKYIPYETRKTNFLPGPLVELWVMVVFEI